VQTIGDANAQKLETMAGPYYGLSAFGTQVDDLLYEGSEIYLKAPCALSPDMTQEEWEALSDPLLMSEEDAEFLLSKFISYERYGKSFLSFESLIPRPNEVCISCGNVSFLAENF